jgi:hypothetical protein
MPNEDAQLRILIVVPHYWGKAKTINEAWQQVKKYSGKDLRRLRGGPHKIYAVWDLDDQKSRLDEFGMLHSPADHPPVCIQDNTANGNI